jgi:hypothetical protein
MSHHPQWDRPAYYGRPSAIDAMGTIAAPFLAGIGIALAVLVISNEKDFGAANEALFSLVVATTFLVACVECAFVARQYVVRPSELQEWRPDPEEDNRVELLEAEQKNALAKFEQWSNRARWAYNVGILAFGAGVAFLLVPEGGLQAAQGWRLWTVVLACAGFLTELVSVLWSAASVYRLKREAKRANSPKDDSGAASGTQNT